jgi:hypothetical protein
MGVAVLVVAVALLLDVEFTSQLECARYCSVVGVHFHLGATKEIHDCT